MSSSFSITRTLLTKTRSTQLANPSSSVLRYQKTLASRRNYHIPTSTTPTTTATTAAAATRKPLISSRAFTTSTTKMGVHNVANKAEFDDALTKDVVVLDCFATWCGPCKVIAPQVTKFSEEFPSAHFIKVDVDEVPDVARELAIRAMPTFIVFKGGDKVGEVVGANPVALRALIEKNVAPA